MTTTLHNNLINGQWVAGSTTSVNINPSNLADVIGDYAQADADGLNAAVLAAQAAFPVW
jgi:acyl-CoA reductase-like NAD-dependent aldehyde dehydrogenase